MIHARQLGKRFGDQVVLQGLSLDVRAGEVAVLIGASGSGKSTLLRCFNGLETFDEGTLQVAGTTLRPDLSAGERGRLLGQIRRRVGMVFQQFNLFPHRNVLENIIEAPVHVLRLPRPQAREEALALLEQVGLADKRDAMPATLSGGQQQRVAIARALAMRPEVILFDEPTSALDPRMAAEVEGTIIELAATGQTMVVVTHSMTLARRAARMMHVLDQGRIVESGLPEQLFTRPQAEATRALLGRSEE